MGAHGSRTLMLPELRRLLDLVPATAPGDAYRAAVIEDNALLKGTVGTRKEIYRRLRELYALDPNVAIFRALRALWDADPAAQPMLALLAALARDPSLRATAEPVLGTPTPEPVSGASLSDAIRAEWPARYGPRSLINLGRNTASTWTQSGHLRGRSNKLRSVAVATPRGATRRPSRCRGSLKAIKEGAPPFDIYVRWKLMHQQPIGWEPDINDGVRLNVRLFFNAGVLRSKFTVNWNMDRGANPDGSERLNDLHPSIEERRAARAAHGTR